MIMNPGDIWRVIGTYTKGYFYLWRFPIQFNTVDKKLVHCQRSSIFFTIWKWGCGLPIIIALLATIITLLWVNFVTPHPLSSTTIVIFFFIGILCVFLLAVYVGILYWMENITEACNELSKALLVLLKGRQYFEIQVKLFHFQKLFQF